MTAQSSARLQSELRGELCTTSAARSPQASLQIPHPHYVSIPMKIDVSAPADKGWLPIYRCSPHHATLVRCWQGRGLLCCISVVYCTVQMWFNHATQANEFEPFDRGNLRRAMQTNSQHEGSFGIGVVSSQNVRLAPPQSSELFSKLTRIREALHRSLTSPNKLR